MPDGAVWADRRDSGNGAINAPKARKSRSELLALPRPLRSDARHSEVGAEVLNAIQACLPEASRAFKAQPNGKYLADLFVLGRQALDQAGVSRIYGGHDCTFSDPGRF